MRNLLKDPWLWLLLALAIALRVWHLVHAQVSPTFLNPAVDPLWYHQAAERVAHGYYGPWPLFRAPLYPALLGWVYRFVENDRLWARILNIICQAAALAVIYHTARTHFGRLAAVVTALLCCVNGMLIFFSAEILSTSLEVLMAALAMWSTLALRKSPSRNQAVITGIVWGLAAITRPNFLLVAPVALAVALWPVWRQTARMTALTGLVALFVPVIPVTLANLFMGGEPVLIATQGGVNFWIGNNPNADGISSILPQSDRFWTLDKATAIAERDAGRKMKPGALSDYYYDKGLDYLLTNPGPAASLMLRKTALFFNRFEGSNNKHIAYYAAQTPGLSWLIALNLALLLPLAILGIWATPRTEARALWLISLTYAATVIMFFIASRFRMPVVPWLCVLAGTGIAGWSALTPKIKATSAGLAAVVLLFAVVNPYHAQEAPLGAARYMDGNAYLAMGKLDSAEVCFTDAMNDAGSRELAQLNLGVIVQKHKRYRDAMNIYGRMLREYPESLPALNNFGVSAEQMHDTARALDAYQRAFYLDSTYADSRENLARLLIAVGRRHLRWLRPWDAREPLLQSIEVLPNPESYYFLALSHSWQGENETASSYLSRALDLKPDYGPAINLMKMIRAAGVDEPVRVPVRE
ncbi:MAG: glycosyltransferase family 39 protein [bacterium]|nr:glycosyltransferase family 39 protein [bacterium]